MTGSKATKETASEKHDRPTDLVSGRTDEKRIALIRCIEWIASILLSAVVLFFLIARTLNAGALWRDECDSLNLARLPRFADVLEYLHYTAFPILFPTIVRSYTTFFGTTDIALRCFGLLVGILFLGAAWFLSRSFKRVPLLLPALIGLNPNFLTAGLWLRGYGLGSVLIVLAFAMTARFLIQPTDWRLAAVFLVYLLSMQCLYFNGVLVPAMVLAATVVLLVRRQWKWMGLLLAAAAVCGLTYVPYIWTIYNSTVTWAVLVQMPFSWPWVLQGFMAACGGPQGIGEIVWGSVIVLCIIVGVWRLKVVWHTDRSLERDMLLFALLVVPLSILAQFGFLRLMRNIVIQRYHLACISLIAAAVTLIAGSISWRYWIFFGRPALVLMVMGLVVLAPWQNIGERVSSIDTIAHRVETDAGPNDLIVMNDGQLGISFSRYYHGTTHWITVPEIDDHRIHRYDLIQKKMTEFFQLDDVEKDVAATLKSGNRVWIVGTVGRPTTQVVLPAPDPTFGWQLPFYIQAWSRELGTFLQRHAGHMQVVIQKQRSVNHWENPQLISCEGWRY